MGRPRQDPTPGLGWIESTMQRKKVQKVIEEPVLSEAFRLSTAQLLGVVAVITGLLIATTAPSVGPSFQLLGQLPGWPEVAGSLLVVTGGLQLWGFLGHRPRVAEMGCWGSTVWYFIFSVTLVIQYVMWAVGDHVNPSPSAYPVAVYLGLSGMHWLQASIIRTKRQAKDAKSSIFGEADGSI